MKAGSGWLGYLGDQGTGHVQNFAFGREGEPKGEKWEWKHHQAMKGQVRGHSGDVQRGLLQEGWNGWAGGLGFGHVKV
jgi:hypothetical protein